MQMAASTIFIVCTAVLWVIGVIRMGLRRDQRALNSFFLGMCVMSFLGIWISAFGGR